MADAARHAEIALRYARKRDVEPFSIAAVRPYEIQRLLADRYGRQLPDDDAGRDDAFVMAHALAWRPNAQRRIPAWLSLWAPWMPFAEAQDLATKVIAKPIRWGADTIGKRLNLIEEKLAELNFDSAPGFLINGLKREQLVAMNSMILHELFFDGLGDESDPGPTLREFAWMTVDLQNPLVAWAAVRMAAIALFSQAYGRKGIGLNSSVDL